MSDIIVWIHGDNLSPNNPALQKYRNAPAVFVWDDGLLQEWAISLKRVMFIYECLLDLPVDITRGDVVDQVIDFARGHDARHIVTVDSPSPRFAAICEAILDRMPPGSHLEVLQDEPFVEYDGVVDLKRFSRYWRRVRSQVLSR